MKELVTGRKLVSKIKAVVKSQYWNVIDVIPEIFKESVLQFE